MRSTFLVTTFLVITIAIATELSAGISSYYQTPTVESYFTDTSVAIDGDLNDTAWGSATKLPLKDNVTGKDTQGKNFSSYAQVSHDSDHLYIAFVNHDRNIWSTFEEHDAHLWEQEVVEVFINTDEQLSTYIELEVSPTNVLFDSFITDTLNIDSIITPQFELAGWQTAVAVDGTVNDSTDTDQKWIVEMALPFTSLIEDYTPEKLSTYNWKINLYRIDRDDDGPTLYAWSPTQKRFHMPSKFGSIVFRASTQ